MRHILFTLKGCNVELMEDTEYMRRMLYKASQACNSTLINLVVHKFDPQGFTGVALLAESHLSVHTWPESGQAICDVFTCGDETTPLEGVEYMKDALEASDIVLNEFERPLA